MLELTEREIKAALVARIEELDGLVRKVSWEGKRGAMDWLVLLPPETIIGDLVGGCGRIYWCELKRPGEKPTPQQAREHERFRALGQVVLVIDSLEAIDRHFPLP